MSTAPVNNVPVRKSFAQVAAAAHKPVVPRPVESPAKNVTNSKNLLSPPSGAVHTAVQNDRTKGHPNVLSSPNGLLNAQLSGMMRAVSLGDAPAHITAQLASPRRKDTSDTKSVASRTTCNMDEKESLRPDDSASVQAAADEEESSPNESTAAASKLDSDPDARAFRDQLYEIDRTETTRLIAQRPLPQCSIPSQQRNGGIIYVASNPTATAEPEIARQVVPAMPSAGLAVAPDEKLQEALASPKDRLFVLKIEQDFIDFINNSKEIELQLPQTNAFYRMLSHKLAEYYSLGHVVDESLSAVRIYRLPYSHRHLPQPLIRSELKSEGATPPPQGSARKIMRRGMSGLTRAERSSGAASQAHSSVGLETSGSEEEKDGKNKDKSALTREEREKQYAEVRARIFEGFAEGKGESAEAGSESNSKGISRSSSNSGHKKTRKHRKPKDDGFEARSAYAQYHGQPYVNGGLPQIAGDNAMYGVYPGYPQFPATAQQFPSSPPPMPPQDYAASKDWSAQSYGASYSIAQSMGSMTPFNPAQYNPSSGSFQPYGSPNLASQSTPRPHQPALASYTSNQMPNAQAMGWMQQQQQQFYAGYPPSNAFIDDSARYMMSCGFTQPDQNSYDPHAFNAYPAQGFNPQSQAFIPAGSPNPNWSTMHPLMHQQQQQHASNPAPSYPSNYASPGPTATASASRNTNNSTTHSPSTRQPLQQTQNNRTPSHQSTQIQHQDSISKWATPPSLPAKPPVPSSTLSFQVPKYSAERQPLPSHPFAATAATAAAANGRA